MSLRGALSAVLLGAFTVGLATAGVLVVLPALIYRRWRRQMHATHG